MELPKLSEIELPNIPIKNPLNTVDTSFNKQDDYRDKFMLHGALAKEGYDWWWHSFTAHHADTGEEKAFFIEFFAINPELGGGAPVFGQLEENRKNGIKPSYLMVKVGTWGADALPYNVSWQKSPMQARPPTCRKRAWGRRVQSDPQGLMSRRAQNTRLRPACSPRRHSPASRQASRELAPGKLYHRRKSSTVISSSSILVM